MPFDDAHNTIAPDVSALDKHGLMNVEDVAELLKVPISWIYEHTRKRTLNRIPGFRLGKYWRFREAAKNL